MIHKGKRETKKVWVYVLEIFQLAAAIDIVCDGSPALRTDIVLPNPIPNHATNHNFLSSLELAGHLPQKDERVVLGDQLEELFCMFASNTVCIETTCHDESVSAMNERC